MNTKIKELVERIKGINEKEIDTTIANNMIDYLMLKTLKKDEENIDYETIEYLEYLKQKVKAMPYPDRISSIRETLIANEQSAILNKHHAMQIKSNDYLRIYDTMIERITGLIRILTERENIDKQKEEER